ncbi:MAG: hypothetical protein BMS9Abin37_2728 [Acidobacteriota bacterium]|nr:MAG: hypothetical protein BMS9Abin37_2728 [Acidobacteriota bacterium]
MARYRHGLAAVLIFWGLAESAQAQWYHARLVTEEGDPIPFFLQLPENCATETATIVNGPESIPTECERSETGFALNFPVYDTRIDARFEPDGSARGEWVMVLPSFGEQATRFEARPVSEPDPQNRFLMESEGSNQPPVDVSGSWRFDFDLYGVGKGVFEQKSSQVVTGTIEVSSEYGDMRFLAGNVRGTHMYLSTFDGRHAFFLEGRVQPDGTMEGEWVHGIGFWDPFVAERAEDFQLADPLDRVRLIDNASGLDLEPLRSAHYAGKAVIVEIFGTWCPNCNDLAPVLADLHRKYRAEGLEILGLAFEYEHSAENERRVREFEKKHGAEWDIVIAEESFEDLVKEGLGGLTPIEGVPVTIFMNRDGTVHGVYTGFSGPATGNAYLEAKARFETLTIEILRSK